MPTVDENKRSWDGSYDWKQAGREWSEPWGGAEQQWYASLLPRIHAFLPARTILEIAPGFGRWTEFLKDACERLILVDLSERCIDACRQRFASCPKLEYHVNDGRSLAMIADESVDFVFSFDSLVHAEDDVMALYLDQLSRKLTPDGVGFLHHSNLGEYRLYYALVRRLPFGRDLLRRLRLLEPVPHWRALSMTAHRFEALAESAGLVCIGQETFPWLGMKQRIDCVSTFTRRGSRWARPNRVLHNDGFLEEAARSARLAGLYGRGSWPAPGAGTRGD